VPFKHVNINIPGKYMPSVFNPVFNPPLDIERRWELAFVNIGLGLDFITDSLINII
jgi:hypothetical protein